MKIYIYEKKIARQSDEPNLLPCCVCVYLSACVFFHIVSLVLYFVRVFLRFSISLGRARNASNYRATVHSERENVEAKMIVIYPN